MESKSDTLLREASTAAKTAREINEKAESDGRPMSTDERADFDKYFKEATDKKARGDQARKDADVTAQVKSLMNQVGGSPFSSGDPFAAGGSSWAKDAVARIRKAMPQVDGQKALVSGTIGTANIIDPSVVRMGSVPLTLLDLLQTRPAAADSNGGNTFSYLRQTVRTNNAAPVVDGALKPTSIYTLAEIEDRFRVIAHLSEPTPLRYFSDDAKLEDFLRNEMEYGLQSALEAQVVSGTGLGENFTGILNTSGIVAVAAVVGDLLATARKAITALQTQGNIPTAFVLNPTDAERFDLVREGVGTGQYLLGGPGSKADQTLWSIPRVSSTSVAAGTAILADWSFAELVVREGATVALDVSGDNFTKNLATMRVEGRFGLAVKRPSAFADITLP